MTYKNMTYKSSKDCCNKEAAGYGICYKCEMCGRKFDENGFLIIKKKKRKIKMAFLIFFTILLGIIGIILLLLL